MENLPPFDPSKCTCSACQHPPCSYCESGEYGEEVLEYPPPSIKVCVNNTGMEDKFDLNIEYLSQPHTCELLEVKDKFGKKQICDKSRFV